MLRARGLFSTAVFAFFCSFVCSVSGSSAFTYQGKLNRDGNPVDGLFDLTFTLHDHGLKGKQVSEAIFAGGVEVVRGYFTVELDFGYDPGNFNGLERYLGIAVKRTGSKEPTVSLFPRQKLSPAPHAGRAQSADRLKPLNYMPDYIVRVDIDGADSQYFHHFNWIGSTTQIVLYRNGGENIERKLPGRTETPILELRRFASENPYMWGWVEQVIEGEFFRKDLDVLLLDREGAVVDWWRLFGAWCSMVCYETDELLKTVVERTRITADRIERVNVETGMRPDQWYPGPPAVVALPLTVEISGNTVKLYDEMTSVGWDIQVVTYQSGEDQWVQKVPGVPRALNVIFARDVVNPDVPLREWRQNIEDGNFDRRSGLIFMRNASGHEVFRLSTIGGWAAELGTQYDPGKNRLEEVLKMACDTVYRQ